MKKAFRAAFPHTIPVMTGYIFVGFAFGILFWKTGVHPILAVVMSIAVYAGSMQFMTVNFLISSMGIVEVILMTLLINARHVFYGLSFIDKFKGLGRKKPYMIFSLTDETFSLLCSAKAPEGVDSASFFFGIALLDQLYWVTGTALGAIAGLALKDFNTSGIEFAMTALFVVIAVEQWLSSPTHIPALVGAGCSLAALLLFGQKSFLLPAMAVIVGMLALLRKPVEKKLDAKTTNQEVAQCQAPDMR
jgi:4-azaleucine resistance transporter AzlC